jgi:hypothetical protein
MGHRSAVTLGRHIGGTRVLYRMIPSLCSATFDDPLPVAYCDASGMGASSDRVQMSGDDNQDFYTHAGVTFPPGDERVRIVRDLNFEYFRGLHVEHFDILYRNGGIIWPARHGTPEPI